MRKSKKILLHVERKLDMEKVSAIVYDPFYDVTPEQIEQAMRNPYGVSL